MMTALIGPTAPPELHVMTFNVRRRLGMLAWPPADRWGVRAPRVRAMLRSERPALVGLQEALADQAEFVRDALGASYRRIGRGRGVRGGGEGCPIVFDGDRLELRDWSQTALSDQPDVPGSRSWGNPVARIAVTGIFRDRSSGSVVTVCNTHFDPASPGSRLGAAAHLRDRVAAFDSPAILMGDLNSPAGSAPVRALREGDLLRDAWAEASTRLTPEWGTYARYRPPRVGARRIDWILTTADVPVVRAAINARRFAGGWPSDHLPVQCVVRPAGAGA